MVRWVVRWIMLALVVLTFAPGTWLRDPNREPDNSQSLDIIELGLSGQRFGALAIEGVWELKSPNDRFGSYSALVAIDGNRLVAGSDMGMILDMPMPGAKPKSARRREPVRIGPFAGKSSYKKALVDIESLTRNPADGRIWVGYEGTNSIERYESDLTGRKAIAPPKMADWPSNSGPEAMTRLDDGRFLVLSEGRAEWLGDQFPGILFPFDPLEGAEPVEFSYDGPAGYRPVDMAQIPDGRVLILLRKLKLGIPPRFETALVLADPAEIESAASAKQPWRGEVISVLTDPRVTDNYEGLAVIPASDGSLYLWLISDDNNSAFQRTLLLQARFDPAAYRAQ